MKTSEKLPQFFTNISSYAKNVILFFRRFSKRILLCLNHLREFQSKKYAIVLAGIILILMLIYTLQRADTSFVHDSLYYWQFADDFVTDSFSFTNFSDGLRGYFFPFLLYLIKVQARWINLEAKLLFFGYSAFFFTLLSIYIIPWAFNNIFRWRISLFGRLLIAIFIFYFWRGHFLYPLSDFPAFTSLLIGVALLAKSFRSERVSYLSILTGFFIGAALNIRPVYLASFMLILPFLVVQIYRLRIYKGVTWFLLVMLGFSLVLLPQLRINQIYYKVNSPWVLARFTSDENLYEKQLFWGLKTQKYEANIGDNYHSIIVVYKDPVIEKLQKTNLLREKTFARYIKIIKRFPLDISLSYFRHMFNGLDIFYSTPYVKNIFVGHIFFSVVNYTIWFLVAFYFFRMDLSKLDIIKTLGLASFLAPVILAIPIVVEVRFFLPAYLMAYGVVSFDFNFVRSLRSLFHTPWNVLRLLIAYAFWLLFCFTMSTATIENLV